MTKAIFTTSEGSAYDDHPESRYHFPKTYLGEAQKALGDLIIYYEPRRNAGLSSSAGRLSYFAVARLDEIRNDPDRTDHFYALMSQYIEFDQPVPFKEAGKYFESKLRKADGSTSKGAFGRSIRSIPDNEFDEILRAGFTYALAPWEITNRRVAEDIPEYVPRPIITQLTNRPFRDQAFRRHVREAYKNTCAISGLSLINGGGRPEVQAAHIRAVEMDGPDTVRNGLALTGTLHWLFDRGLISVDDNYRILTSSQGLPDQLDRLIPNDRMLRIPVRPELRPHPIYLKWHRDYRFKA